MANDSAPAAQKTVLVVDDKPFFLNLVKTQLNDPRYNVVCVNSGAAALFCLKKHKPDLFILDIEMPEMNGYELVSKIKDLGFSAPVIFLTANKKNENLIKAQKAGAVDFLVKPINKQQLIEKVEKYI